MLTFFSSPFFDLPDRNCRLLRISLLEHKMRWIMLGPRGLRGLEGVRGGRGWQRTGRFLRVCIISERIAFMCG